MIEFPHVLLQSTPFNHTTTSKILFLPGRNTGHQFFLNEQKATALADARVRQHSFANLPDCSILNQKHYTTNIKYLV